MITVIAGTNRKNSASLQLATAYAKLLTEQQIPNEILDIAKLPADFIFSALYGNQNDAFNEIFQKKIVNARALVIISPEYNGSYPGVLKAFIDGWDRNFLLNKKVALVGVASGRQGNARGMDHLTNVLNYLEMNVIPFKLPISKVHEEFNEKGELMNEETIKALKKQIEGLS